METPKLNEKYVSLHLQFEIVHVLFFSPLRLQTGPGRIQAFSNRTTDPSYSWCDVFQLYTDGSQRCFAMVQSHQAFNKSDQENLFSPSSALFLELLQIEVWCLRDCQSFFSNTEVFNVCRESHSGAIKTAASDAHHVRALMMNGCLVCWFYGASAVRFSRGRRSATGLEGGTPR